MTAKSIRKRTFVKARKPDSAGLLLGYARVQLEPGEAVVVHFAVPTARIAFSGRDLVRAVEPGTLELWVGGSCAESDVTGSVELVGKRYEIGPADARWVDVVVEPW